MNNKKTYWIAGIFTAVLLLSAVLYKALANSYENKEAFKPQGDSTLASNDSNLSGEQADATQDNSQETEDSQPFQASEETNNENQKSALTDSASETIIPQEAESNGPSNNNTNETVTPEENLAPPAATPTKMPQTNDSTAPTKTPQATTTPLPTRTPQTTNTPSPTRVPQPTNTPAPTTPPVNKNTATNFTVYDGNGNAVSLSDYFGKPIVVNFWASWCGPCKSEMPGFDRMYQRYQGEVVFLMVDMVDGYRETKELGQSFVNKNGYSFPVFFDTKQSASYAYSVTSYPTTLFIDANGNVTKIKKGAMSESTLESEISAILN